MRIRNIITLLLLPLLATACNTDKGDAEGVVPTPVELVIRASQGVTTRASVVEDPEIVVGADLAATAASTETTTSPDTRTELGPVTGNEQQISGNEQQIYWSGPVESDVPGEDKPGDQIMVWATPNSTNTVGYAFEQTVFSLAHFNYTYSSADFTATVAERMYEDYTYTYHAIYPSPRSRKLSGSSYTESAVDGITMNTDGTVTYSLPTTQTGDYNGAYDIMRGTATGAALNDSSDTDNSIWPQPELRMQHLMHLMRIRVPENRNLMGRSIKRLEITFPEAIVGGTVTFNPTDPSVDPSVYPTWDGQSTKVTIDFDDTNLLDAAGRDVWIFVKPGEISGVISFQAYDTAGVPAAAISTTVNKTLLSQHITPIALTIPESPYGEGAGLKLTVAKNNLGESLSNIVLAADGYTFLKPFTTTTSANSITLTPDSSTSQTFTVTVIGKPSSLGISYVSAHASIQGRSLPLSTANTTFEDTTIQVLESELKMSEVNNVKMVVPYLYYEDFSGVTSESSYYYSGSNSWQWTESSNTHKASNISSLNGWTGARWQVRNGSISVSAYTGTPTSNGTYAFGRIDSKAMTNISKNCNISVSFSYSGDLDKGGLIGGFAAEIYFGISETQGIINGTAKNNKSTPTKYNSKTIAVGDDGATGMVENLVINNCSSLSRLSWCNNITDSMTRSTAFFTVSNIKVSIAQ